MKLVCLPGLDGTGALFSDFVRALPADVSAQVVAYPTDEVLDGAALEARVEAQLPREPFVLLGESFSGPIALRLAAKAPPGPGPSSGIAGLVLVATFARRPVSAALGNLAPLLGAPLFSLTPPRVLIRRVLAGADAQVELVERVRAELSRVRPEVLAARVREVVSVDASDAARRCAVPALYLRAAHDALLRPEVVDELRALMPALEVETLAAPHLVLQRAPEEAARRVAFVTRAVRGSAHG